MSALPRRHPAPYATAASPGWALAHRAAGISALVAGGLVAGCGGGGSSDGGSSGGGSGSGSGSGSGTGSGSGGLSDAQRTSAAAATAQSASNACGAIQPFYWEIGDKSAAIASGSVNGATSGTTYAADSLMSIASASKWLYASYVVQKQGGVLSDSDIKYLTFRSGYTDFSTCLPGQTVDGCVNYLQNGVHDPSTDGYFYYGGGHMEMHAETLGLGSLDSAGLAAEVQSQIGTDVGLSYSQPQPAGGGVDTPDGYAHFLRKLLDGSLIMGSMLGTHAVCTNPATCAQALSVPVPETISWHYSIGHWVEDDPTTGDGAFSSPGAFGFYPWIDATKTWYGIVARRVDNGYYESAQCGALIRKAWTTGVAQTS